MNPIQGTGRIINIECTDIVLPEFPKLLFGNHSDGSKYFDATFYLQEKDPSGKLNVEDFFKQFNFQIKAITKTYNLQHEQLVLINNKGHQLINGHFCYPFLSYIDPQFCVYINEIIEELFVHGVVVSDTHLITSIKRRLTPELWKQIWNDDTTELGGS